MHFKLIVALVEDARSNKVVKAAREAGATGVTIINQARGSGLEKSRSFFGLGLELPTDVLLMLVEEHLSREILETISRVGGFDEQPGSGIAFKLDVEDAVGVQHQIESLTEIVEETL